MRDFVHVADVARANLAAIEASGDGTTGAIDGVQRLLRLARLDPRRGPVLAGTDREPVVTGQYRAGDVRHVVASPARAAAELGFTATVTPEQGLAAFATAPLRD